MPADPAAVVHPPRVGTGIPGLDGQLGGGLLPGTLTVVVGATGIGKTQLGLQFAHAGLAQEGHRGVILDLASRGDSQSHADYARRMFGWSPVPADGLAYDHGHFFSRAAHGDYLHGFDYSGRRVSREELDSEQWQKWQEEVNRRLHLSIEFLYGNFTRGCRRVVVDGIEPVDRPRDSIQFYLFEYVYHQIVRKDPEWVARDLFREHYREHAAEAVAHRYDPRALACLLLVTAHAAMLEELITDSLDEGDVLSNANTLIYMGKVRDGTRMRRALYIAKHRGSACSEEILYYRISDQGVALE